MVRELKLGIGCRCKVDADPIGSPRPNVTVAGGPGSMAEALRKCGAGEERLDVHLRFLGMIDHDHVTQSRSAKHFVQLTRRERTHRIPMHHRHVLPDGHDIGHRKCRLPAGDQLAPCQNGPIDVRGNCPLTSLKYPTAAFGTDRAPSTHCCRSRASAFGCLFVATAIRDQRDANRSKRTQGLGTGTREFGTSLLDAARRSLGMLASNCGIPPCG